MMEFLQVSYCSQLKCAYLEHALRQWSKLESAHLLYVPSIKNSTVQTFKEYCPSLQELCVQGTRVSLDALVSLSSRGVKIDVLENDFPRHQKVPLQS